MKKILFALGALLFSSLSFLAHAQTLSIASGGRYLTSNGNPFLIVGENAEALAQALPLTGTSSGDAQANATYYLSTRASQGMNAIWMLAYCGDYNACNTNSLSPTYDGLMPFTATISTCGTTTPDCWDMTATSNTYWARIDAMINLAAQYGIVVFLDPIPTNACNTRSPAAPEWTMLQNNYGSSTGGHTRSYLYGQFLGNRYKGTSNIVWYHGNDYQCQGQGGGTPAADDVAVQSVMQGITAAGDTHPATIELNFFSSTSYNNTDFLPTGPGGGGNVNVNGVYTYYPAYDTALYAWNQTTAPAVVLEEYYEGSGSYLSTEPTTNSCYFPGSSGCLYEYEIRKQFWQSFLGGAVGGFIFGVDPIGSNGFCTWNGGSNCTAGTGWTPYMQSPGWRDYGHWASLLLNNGIPWWAVVPDQSNVHVTGGRGTYNSGGCSSGSACLTKDNYVPAASYSTASGSGLLAYVSCYSSNATYACTGTGGVTVAMNHLGTGPTARWYDPTNGQFTVICSPTGTACSTGSQTFTPSGVNGAGDPDWVLVVTAAAPSITGVSLSNTSETAPFSGTIGSLSTTCSVTCPGNAAYAVGTGTGCTSGQTADNANFTTSGASLNTTGILNPQSTTTYKFGVVDTMSGVSNSGHCWPLQATVGSVCATGTLCAPLSISITPATPPTTLTPVAEWVFNSASVSGTTEADSTGHGNTCTIVNGPLNFGSRGAIFNGSSQYCDNSTLTPLAVVLNPTSVTTPCAEAGGSTISSVTTTGGDGNPITLSLSGDTTDYQLSSTTPPASLQITSSGYPPSYCSASSSFQEQVTVTATQAGSSPLTGQAFTVTGLINAGTFTNGASNPRIVGNSHTDGEPQHAGFELMFNNGGHSGSCFIGNGSTAANAGWTQSLATGAWYFLACTYDGSKVVSYINASQVGTATLTGNMAPGTGPDVNVGRNINTTDYFQGEIYDVRIYNTALSGSQLLTLYHSYTFPLTIAVNPTSANFTCGVAGGTVVSAITTQGGDGNAITLSINDTTDYQLSSTTPPANLEIAAGGLPSGDCNSLPTLPVTVTASQS